MDEDGYRLRGYRGGYSSTYRYGYSMKISALQPVSLVYTLVGVHEDGLLFLQEITTINPYYTLPVLSHHS